MKPTTDIEASFLENGDLFHDPFYKRFNLRHAPAPLRLTDEISKNYTFPTFYGDVTCAIGIFLCDYEKAQAMMPHPEMKPVKMTMGRSLVIFSCYIYNNVMNVAPYNEIAMTIPVMVKPNWNPPVLPMIMSGAFKKFGYYVFSMPVTSLENKIRGRKIWGLPKEVQEIDIVEKDGDCITTAMEETGETYFQLNVPTSGKATDFDVSSYLYSRLGDELLQSQTCFKATFNVNKYMKLLLKKDLEPDRPYLTLGDTESAKALRDLEIEKHPFQFRFARGMTACFDL
ncbi:acetoacetate decarboxylase family protein, partial [bacterium]|nr:acetoacetate decarboxylase family protein [bacterium]